jgi:hypothetical protein
MKAIYIRGHTDPIVISSNDAILDEILSKPPFGWDRHAYIDEWDEKAAAEAKLMGVVDALIRAPEMFEKMPKFGVSEPESPHRVHAVPPESVVGVYEAILNAMKSNKAGSLLRTAQDEAHQLRDKLFARENQPLEQLLTRLKAFLGVTSRAIPEEVKKEFYDLRTALTEFESVSRRVTDK